MNFAALRPFANLVQHGYVTTDLERAVQRFAECGASEFARPGEIVALMIGDRRAIMSAAGWTMPQSSRRCGRPIPHGVARW